MQPLDRHVLLRSRQRARDRAIHRVLEDCFGLLGVGGLLVHEPIECRGGVEHQRPQLTGRLGGAATRQTGHAVRRIGRGTGLETQCVGEPPGRIDGDHDDSTAGARGSNAEGRRCGGLSDAAGTARDDQCRRGHLIGERFGNITLACTHVDTSSGSMSGPTSASASTPRWCSVSRGVGRRGSVTIERSSVEQSRSIC